MAEDSGQLQPDVAHRNLPGARTNLLCLDSSTNTLVVSKLGNDTVQPEG